MRVNIRVVEVIRLIDAKYLGNDTAKHWSRLLGGESRWGECPPGPALRGLGCVESGAGYQERGHWEGGDQNCGSESVRLEMPLEMPGSNQMDGSQGER